jgi:hypothetical protein
VTRPSDAPGVELARAKAALRRAASAWDDVLRGFAAEEEAQPFSPVAEEEPPEPPESRESLRRREETAKQMRLNWPDGKPRRRWWPKR